MAHLQRERNKVLLRVRRIAGQVGAIERALEEERTCEEVLQLVAAVRGATAGLMAELLEDHLRLHVLEAKGQSERAQAVEQLVDALRTYLR
ncbi:MAG TPA: metal/formaldehyde-sensitive transcriptional repressor [Myxococcaceae bacterium]|nr:metal/formaldehyde-sensitive transcriptional repressor [Myxococcaceae bacterium]